MTIKTVFNIRTEIKNLGFIVTTVCPVEMVKTESLVDVSTDVWEKRTCFQTE